MRDNCCILRDKSICIVLNIVMNNNSYRLGVKKFLEVDDFYNIGMLSSALQIYKCSTLSNEIVYIPLDEVHAKCFRMPLCNLMQINESNSDEEEQLHSETTRYVVAAIVHSKKM